MERAERTIDKWTVEDEDKYIGLACKNVVAPDGAFRCPTLAKAGLKPNDCVASIGALRVSTRTDKERHAFRLIVAGLSHADSCALVDAGFRIAAMSLVERDSSATDSRGDARMTCRRRRDFAFDLSSEEVLLRRGLGDRLFSDTPSTQAAPIEVCGLLGELTYLTRVTCADGSRPWGRDHKKAHAARKGSGMSTGRCRDAGGTPVDQYSVPCPEQQYTVYIDMYECGPGERFDAR